MLHMGHTVGRQMIHMGHTVRRQMIHMGHTVRRQMLHMGHTVRRQVLHKGDTQRCGGGQAIARLFEDDDTVNVLWTVKERSYPASVKFQLNTVMTVL